MEYTETTKLLFGLITAIGTIAVTFFNLGQTRKIRAELLDKFEMAIEKLKKHSATELFRLIHGLRMNYSDIVELIQHDECSKIIYALKKTPGLVCYENGEFQYTKIGRNSIFQYIDRRLNMFAIVIFAILSLMSLAILVYSKNTTTVVGGLSLLIFFSFILAMQLRERRYDQMVACLVNPENTEMRRGADVPAD